MSGSGSDRAVARASSASLEGAQLRAWRIVMVLIAVCGLALDQTVKALAAARLNPYDPPSFFGGLLRLQLLRNSGAAFSMGSSATVVISLFGLAVLAVVIGYVAPRARRRWTLVACGMVMAGISGNLTDRLFRAPGPLRGEVVDMFALPHFAVFNVADMFITGAAVLVVAAMLFGDREGR